jgi:hypothetical protein
MSSIRKVFILMVCICSSIGLTGNGAAAQCASSERVSALMSMLGDVVSGISVTREETAPHQLQVEICGSEVTRLRHGFPLIVEMSDTVHAVVVRNADAGMAVGATVGGRSATVTLARDPFIPPEPWRVVVLLSVEGSLGEGHIVVGTARHPLPTPLLAGRTTVVLGTGCEERYAGKESLSWKTRVAGAARAPGDSCTGPSAQYSGDTTAVPSHMCSRFSQGASHSSNSGSDA